MLNKLGLKMKLGVGFGALLVILAVTCALAYHAVENLDEAGQAVNRKATEKEQSVYLMEAVLKESAGARGYLLVGQEQMLQLYEDGKREHEEAIEKLASLVRSGEGKRLTAEIQRTYDLYVAAVEKEIQLRKDGKTKEAIETLTGQTAPAFVAVDKAASDFAAHLDEDTAKIGKEQDATVSRSKALAIGLAIAGTLLGLIIAAAIASSIIGGISNMVVVIQEIANKNLTIADIKITSADEIGKAGVALNEMKNSLHAMIQSIGNTAHQVAASSEELSATSRQITANSEETTAQAHVVSEAGSEVNTNLQTLASGAEEMSSTIGEIAKNATEAARVSSQAVEAAESANQTVSRLGESSVEIAKVIEVITSIAQQTNLLALNATIEAARAGEAGKEFAVVANEVKELAKQTAKATEEITHKIGAIRQNTDGAVAAIGGIKVVIDKISHISTVIAKAVEEQSATTSEMARNVTEAARGATTISENIKGVAEAAQNTSANVGEAQTATDHLAQVANQLRDLVGHFQVNPETGANRIEASPIKTAGHAAGAR